MLKLFKSVAVFYAETNMGHFPFCYINLFFKTWFLNYYRSSALSMTGIRLVPWMVFNSLVRSNMFSAFTTDKRF